MAYFFKFYSSILQKVISLPLLILLLGTLQILPPPSSVWAEEPKASTPPTSSEIAVDVASLVLQPVYLAAKLGIAVCGVAISAVTLLATGGNEKKAKEIFDASLAGPWGVPELYKQIQEDIPQKE